jgi:hypothetical protein
MNGLVSDCPNIMTVAELFDEAKLSPCGPVRWGTEIPEPSAGVYVVALVGETKLGCQVDADFLEPLERQRWLPTEPVIYIGQTTTQTLAKRLGQFYLHKYGDKRPHYGGQAVKLLLHPPPPRSPFDLWVYWSLATDPRGSERTMIDAFKERVGTLPFANRR